MGSAAEPPDKLKVDSLNATFLPGEKVFWWKRVTRTAEFPYRAEVVSVRKKRVTILVEDPGYGTSRVIRHVAPERLQPVAMYHQKAAHQFPNTLESMASWGRFTRYLEIGADLRAVRHIDVFENGNMLCYDRTHWVDDFGMLADARINRNHTQDLRWQCEEITAAEFESRWETARRSVHWQKQKATAQMLQLGDVPVWFTI